MDEAVYPAEAVQKALYWLSDRAPGCVARVGQGNLSVSLQLLKKDADPETVRGEFLALVTDFVVRRQIDTETRPIRELIFAKALAASGALEDPPPGDDRDPVELARSDTSD